jgi:sulfite exporter TauE/SafE
MIEAFWPAFLVGLLGSVHCFGMCGGISAALSFAIAPEQRQRRIGILTFYNIGRIASYVFMAALVGLLGSQISSSGGWPVLRMLTAALLCLMGLYVSGWWRILVHLERAGALLWKRIEPIGRSLMPVKSFPQALALGALWGWLPCGLVYSALVLAMSMGSVTLSTISMLGFGVGTLPALLLSGVLADQVKRFTQSRSLRSIAGILLIVFGLWTAYSALGHAGHAHHGTQDSSSEHQHHHHHHGH